MDYKSKTANDKEISIYYFSATGNSLKLSQDIAAAFGGAGLFRMTPSAGITASDSRIVGFIFPVYMGGLPGIVRRFLESYPFRKGVYYFSIGTYYTYKGCAVSVVDKIMSGKGVRLDYGYNLPEDGLYVTEEFYNQYPEVVRKLVKASMRGWAWTNEHREEALDMVMEEVKKGNIGTNRYHQRKMLEEVLRLQVDQQSGQRTYRLSREGFARAAMILTPAGSASIRYEDFVK